VARHLRIQYPGACYHVTCRGNERASIFRDDKDRRRFLKALEETIEAFRIELHCYTLMSNHFHFLLKTPEANLSRFMQRFNTAYTTYYNLRHQRCGHLYQGRYKAILVDADEYLLELSRYIHLNPVRLEKYSGTSPEKKAEILKNYVWSSLPGYMSSQRRKGFIHYKDVLGYMGEDNRKGRQRYGEFVLKGTAENTSNPFDAVKANVILGTDTFIEWVKERFLDAREWPSKDYPHIKTLRKAVLVEEVAEAVAKEYGVTPHEILMARSPWREARQVLIEVSYRANMTKRSLNELGQELGGISGDAVAHAHERIKRKMMEDHELSQRVDRIYRNISQ